MPPSPTITGPVSSRSRKRLRVWIWAGTSSPSELARHILRAWPDRVWHLARRQVAEGFIGPVPSAFSRCRAGRCPSPVRILAAPENARGAAAWPLLGLLGRRFAEVAPAASGPHSVCLLTIATRGHFIHHPFSVDWATSRKKRRLYFVSAAGTVPLCIKRRPREPAL